MKRQKSEKSNELVGKSLKIVINKRKTIVLNLNELEKYTKVAKIHRVFNFQTQSRNLSNFQRKMKEILKIENRDF